MVYIYVQHVQINNKTNRQTDKTKKKLGDRLMWLMAKASKLTCKALYLWG